MDLDALVGGRVSVPKEQALQLAFTTWGFLNGVWCTLWLCQNSYWKLPFIVDFPINSMVIFHSYVNVYQRVNIWNA